MSDQQDPTPQRTRAIWERAFFKVLRRFGNVTKAAKAARIDRTVVYDYKKNYPDFAAEWVDALDEAADHLEAEAWRRAVKGTKKPVYQKGLLVGYVQEYSDSLMAQLLKAHKPDKYRDRTEVTGENGGPLTIRVVYEDEKSS